MSASTPSIIMTTAKMTLKRGVAKAIDEIKSAFRHSTVQVVEAPCGGAHDIIDGVALGPPYEQNSTWFGFFLTDACPYADVYPLYVRGDLSRIDGQPLKSPLNPNQN